MKRRTFLAATSATAVGGLAGCSSPGADEEEATTEPDEEATTADPDEETTTAADGETTTATEGGAVEVAMVTEGSDYYFDPIGVAVEPGTTVTFVNESGSHSSTAYAEGNGGAEVRRIPEDAEAWNSETLTEEGATFEHTFEVEGTYDYFCIPHKTLGMVGRIVVGEPGGVEGDPPDGDVPDAQTIVDEGPISYDEFSG